MSDTNGTPPATREIQAFKVRAFVDDSGRGGNPAGVVLAADQLSSRQKQAVAARLGLSETAFFSLKNKHVRFFTPTREIPFCGHATVATFSLLASKKILPKLPMSMSVQMGGGWRDIIIDDDGVALQQDVELVRPLDAQALEEARQTFQNGGAVRFGGLVDNGVKFFVLELESAAGLRELKPDFEKIDRLSRAHELVGYYLYFKDGDKIEARMFAPAYGINEESATGMGAGALAAWLNWRDESTDFTILQGAAMTPPSPSILHTHVLRSGFKTEVWVKGRAVVDSVETVAVP
ncbi:MAG TPA: PhzF family phenazine biosynthesis protein [Bdellovibrionales bacterium]|nr:PhzF family phenazine biosynthesis protein [Bdellovibrionales bacterium]